MGDFFKFMKGIWYGALIGAVAALLFAPKRGEELRRDIRHEAEALRDEARSKLEQASTTLDRQADKLEQKVQEVQEQATGDAETYFGQ